MKRVGDQDWTPFKGMLPEGARPMQGLRILVYMDEDGLVEFQSAVDSENTSLGVMVGFLAEVQHDLIHDLLMGEDE
jgi:hypothetical protein